ncbi:MAG: metallophosphoesterase family protein [Chloroflexi bacterium]|nr:metallophosphoesterase family protein [Chloroflexota bacterium]
MLIGVISDTHGLLDPKVDELFTGVDLILHGGDVGGRDILTALSATAPVLGVRGNVDVEDPSSCSSLPESLLLTAAGVHLYMTHVFTPSDEGVGGDDTHAADVVIFGHSHQQYLATYEGVLYFNPASAGRKRFRNPRSVGLIEIGAQGAVEARFESLE